MDDQFARRDALEHLLSGSPFAIPEPVVDLSGAASDPCLILARTIEREVIPRLLLKLRFDELKQEGASRVATFPVSAPPDIEAFCRMLIGQEMGALSRHVAEKMRSGTALEAMLLELFAPSARRLGAMWDNDECSFLDVTVGLGKLQQLVRESSETYRANPDPKKLGFRALLTTARSNQHILGLSIVEQLFRNAGWNVLCLPAPEKPVLIEAVQQEWFAVAGISISCDDGAAEIPALIAAIRRASLNRSIIILAGGRYIADNPEKAAALGADLAGDDAKAAIAASQVFLASIGRTS